MQILGRRDLLLLGATMALALRPAAAARKIPRIGFIGSGAENANLHLLEAFRDGLEGSGWMEQKDVVILDRWPEDHTEQLPRIVRELIGAGLDLLVTAGTPATLAARSATATVPIVMVGVSDPVALGIVSSLDRPGGNTTGLSLNSPGLIARRLELLRALVPSLSRIAVIIRNDPGLEQRLLDIRTSAAQLGIRTVEFVAPTGRAIELAFLWLRSEQCDALYVASGPLGPAKRAEIIKLTAEARIPAIYSYPVFPAAGGLMSLAADDEDLFRRAATYVDELLNGASPADLPVGEPGKFKLVINLKTAKALGLTIQQSILARVDEVVE
jgi:putative ABC transport system substrate-binding protein